MRIIKDIRQMPNYIKQVKGKGKSIGFVPTMGYLHEGHLSLVRKARKETNVVIISIFVNPTQFGPAEDYKRYPRNIGQDKRLAREVGVDVIFAPSASAMYPKGYLTYVETEDITEVLCGSSRAGHFRGVTTVVMKLFNIIKPDVAYFGQKDAQQAIVIKRMVEDLNMGIKIKVLPIVREADGLAMSSRNLYLSDKERKDATVLYQSLQKAKELIKYGERDLKRLISVIKKTINQKRTAKIDYVSIVETRNLSPVKEISGEILIAVAVWIGKTRLIDNIIVKSK